MNGFDRQIYRECKGFFKPTGVTNPTDAEVIVEMSKRQEYSDKAKADAFAKEKEALCAEIDKLKAENKSLQTDITLLKIEKYSDVIEEPKRGKTVTFEFNGKSHKLMVTKVTEDISGTVILEGKWAK